MVIVYSVALAFLTFVFFVALISLRDMRDSGRLAGLHWSVAGFAYSALAVGLMLDVALNWTVFTVIMLEIPQELLTTQRVRRHKRFGSGWRQRLACWVCRNYLTPIDPTHCE